MLLLRSRIYQLEAELQTQSVAQPEIASFSESSTDHGADETPVPGRNVASCRLAEKPDSVMRDAASILEFLAWGRRKNTDYNSVLSPEAGGPGATPGDVCDAQPDCTFLNDQDDTSSQTASLQLLLPSQKQLWELIQYHEECLLWYHCAYYPPSFRTQVQAFFTQCDGVIARDGVNLQWVALLFAVMTASITCAPNHRAQEWGFRSRERETLSRKWFRAVYICLNAAEYAANQSTLSVQAIATQTISAHLLGYSNMQSVHMAAAVRIAQGLGLHRISDDGPGTDINTVVNRECGRRLWSQLCCQDWFSIPFSDTYLINPSYSQSSLPGNCHDEDMIPLPDNIPTITTYCRLLTRIAGFMPQLQDDLLACNTSYTKYEQVIKWDKQMRTLSTSERPTFLLNTPIQPSWPAYVPWARRSLAISSAHKIIMIHRSFLSESFTNSAFSFTRRTCLAASKTIIKEYKLSREDDDEPILWIHQAFSVAASIILLLDVLHRDPTEAEYSYHKKLAEDTVEILRQCQNSMIATRGVNLLSALLDEISQSSQTQNSRKRRHDGSQPHSNRRGNTRGLNKGISIPKFVTSFCNGKGQSTKPSNSQIDMGYIPDRRASADTEISSTVAAFRHSMSGPLDPLSGQTYANEMSFFSNGLDGGTAFDNLLYLANHDFI